MSQSLNDLLKNRSYDEPSEVVAIKRFVEERFKQTPIVSVAGNQLVIGVKSAALAGALRPLLPELQDKLVTDKQLRIRIQ
jgi:hypothetical protein